MNKLTIRILVISAIFALYLLGLYHLGMAIVLIIYFVIFWVVNDNLMLDLGDKLATSITNILYEIRAKYYDYLIKRQLKRINKEDRK